MPHLYSATKEGSLNPTTLQGVHALALELTGKNIERYGLSETHKPGKQNN